ncbi:hypothetical protein D3C72_1523420 [compost metagenome]
MSLKRSRSRSISASGWPSCRARPKARVARSCNCRRFGSPVSTSKCARYRIRASASFRLASIRARFACVSDNQPRMLDSFPFCTGMLAEKSPLPRRAMRACNSCTDPPSMDAMRMRIAASSDSSSTQKITNTMRSLSA